jgi:hypothetical protein
MSFNELLWIFLTIVIIESKLEAHQTMIQRVIHSKRGLLNFSCISPKRNFLKCPKGFNGMLQEKSAQHRSFVFVCGEKLN